MQIYAECHFKQRQANKTVFSIFRTAAVAISTPKA